MSSSSPPHLEIDGDLSRRDVAARFAGALLMLTAVLTAISAFGRLAADADQATLTESLQAISLNSGLYGLGGAARLLSGITLIAAAGFLLRTWSIRNRLGSPIAPSLFRVSGVFTAISGLVALVLAMSAPEPSLIASHPELSGYLEYSMIVRWLTGKIGFAVAGLALMAASRSQWRVGGVLQFIAPISAILGICMQFVWIDSATMVHPIIGSAFFIWLLTVGGCFCGPRGCLSGHSPDASSVSESEKRPGNEGHQRSPRQKR